MAQAINTLGVIPDFPISNPAYKTGADKTATVNDIDLGATGLWFIQAKISVKANGGTLTYRLVLSDTVAPYTNPQDIVPVMTMTTSSTGMFVLTGMGNNSTSRYLNIVAAVGTSVSFDYEVFGTTVA